MESNLFLAIFAIIMTNVLVVMCAGGHLLSDVGLAVSPQDGAAKIKASLCDGRAMDKFRAMLVSQGVDRGTAHALCKPGADVFHVLPAASYKTDVFSPITGMTSTPSLKLCSQLRSLETVGPFKTALKTYLQGGAKKVIPYRILQIFKQRLRIF